MLAISFGRAVLSAQAPKTAVLPRESKRALFLPPHHERTDKPTMGDEEPTKDAKGRPFM